jgi:RimJ/RimL family protein N-acetyltransferase
MEFNYCLIDKESMELAIFPHDVSLLESYYGYYLDEETRRYDPFPAPGFESLIERLGRASSQLSEFQGARSYFWFLKSDSKLVAHVSLNNLNPMMMTAEIGFGVHPSARGRGIAKNAIRTITQKVFAESAVRKLIAHVHEDNVASRRALESVGYFQEGLFRESYILNGLPCNEAVYGILRNDSARNRS